MWLHKLAFSALLLAISSAALGIDPALQPATRPARSSQEVMADWRKATLALRAVLPAPQAVADPDARKQVAPTAVPLLWNALALTDELYQVDTPSRAHSRQTHYQLLAILAFLDDANALKELADAKESNNLEVSLMGRQGWYLAQWWKNAEDPVRSGQVLDELEGLAKANPYDNYLAGLLMQIHEEGVATADQTKRIETIIATHLRGPTALKIIEQLKAADKRRSLLGKPLVIAGKTLAGKPFSTASLKGKTLLVHFGATWWNPWEVEHNRLLEFYQHTDAANLEFVTVLCDENAAELAIYRERHNEVPWPVLWDAPTAEDSHRPTNFAAQYGIEDFPTTLVIGPDGTVEQVDVTPDAKLLEQLSVQRPAATTKPAQPPSEAH